MSRPSVYDYLDYRSYLADMFNFRKQKSRAFSYRFFSAKAGFSSPNFLKLVTNGQRNLTSSSIAKMAKGFGLKSKEREFFENLVFMNQATTHDEKNHYYCKMVAIVGSKKTAGIDKKQYEYFSKWYYPAIREMAVFKNGDGTADKIASRLTPKLSAREVEGALSLLERLNLLKKDQDGHWQQVHRDITTGPEIKSMVVCNFHKEMMRLAAESIDRIHASERDISGVTLSIRKENIPELKSRLVSLRKELLEMASTDDDPDTVVQVNIQLFPLTN